MGIFKVKMSLNFSGTVNVMAENAEEARMYVKEKFHGCLGSCGDSSDENLVDWDVCTTSNTEIMPSEKTP